MKKVIVIAILAMSTVSMYAQKFGVKAGLDLSTYVGSDAEGSKTKAGFLVGGLVEFPLSKTVFLQPELLLIEKGTKIKDSGIEMTMRPLYLEVPVNLMLKSELGTGKITLSAGPYIAIGIGGKASYEGLSVDLFSKVAGADEALLKRFDAGLGANVGYEIKSGLFFNLGTSFGFSNVFNQDNTSVKNSTVTLSAGYKF